MDSSETQPDYRIVEMESGSFKVQQLVYYSLGHWSGHLYEDRSANLDTLEAARKVRDFYIAENARRVAANTMKRIVE